MAKSRKNVRRCMYPGCDKILSQYNKNESCWSHTVKYAEHVDKQLFELEHELNKHVHEGYRYRRPEDRDKANIIRRKITALQKHRRSKVKEVITSEISTGSEQD